MKLFLAFVVSALLLLSVAGPLIGLIVAGDALKQIEGTGIDDAVDAARRDLRRLYETLESEETRRLAEVAGEDLDRAAAGAGRLTVVGRLVRESLATTLVATAIASIAIAVAVVVVTHRTITRPIGRASAFLSMYPKTRGRLATPGRAATEIKTLAATANEMLDRIEEQNLRIKRAERENLGRFVVHQLKNSLTPIGLAAREIRRSGHGADTRALDLIEGQAHRVERLVEQFRTVYRTPTPFRETRELGSLLGDICAALESEFPDLEVNKPEITVAPTAEGVATVPAAPYMSAGAPNTTVACDVGLLTESFRNLAANSRDAGATAFSVGAVVSPGGIGGKPDTAGDCPLLLWARDSGPGVPEGLEAAVFQDEVTTKSQGMGLGLAFVARVVEAHGWSIRVLPGPGARVEITIGEAGQR